MQQSGNAGFTITYWRKVYRGDDLVRDETFTARYKPEDRILEIGPKKPKPPPTRPVRPAAATRAPPVGGTADRHRRAAGHGRGRASGERR